VTNSQKTLLRLWFVRFIIVYERLISDGFTRQEVVNLFHFNRLQVGFVWSKPYPELYKGTQLGAVKVSKLSLMLRSIYNLTTIIRLFFYANFRTANVLTRNVSEGQFCDPTIASCKKISIKRDLLNFRWISLVAKERKVSDLEFHKLFSKYDGQFSEPYLSWALEDIYECLPYIFKLKPRIQFVLCRNLNIVNFSGDIFKSEIITSFVWLFFRGNLLGAQHGGGYGLLDTPNFNLEIGCYEKFIFQKLNTTSKPFSGLEFVVFDRPVCLLLGSMPVECMEAFRKHISKENSRIIEIERLKLRQKIKKNFLNYYIREHPKSKKKSNGNVNLPPFKEKKPIFAVSSDGIIIIEAPGTTAELSCLQFGMNYICVFNIEAYPLTETGKRHYKKLKAKNQMYSLSEFIERFDHGKGR